MHGARRVIVFCLLTAVLPTILLIIPLYLRHSVFSDVTYSVAESDVLEITDGISSIFCQEHSLRMNTSFNAYQLSGKPEIGNSRKHIRLKKSMSLLDDTLEYWGFFLLKGSTVNLSVCSRFAGSRILVVEGEKNLRTCGLLQHSKGLPQVNLAKDPGQVKVTFESYAQIVDSDSINKVIYNDETARKIRATEYELENYDSVEDENLGLQTFKVYAEYAKNYIEKHTPKIENVNSTFEEKLVGHKLRHARGRSKHILDENDITSTEKVAITRDRRDTDIRSPHNLDAKVAHGGSIVNVTKESEESSLSSFESNLLNCYDGNILLTQGFPPSDLCTSTSFFESYGQRMVTTHDVVSDGYYYYIFYSDNDFVKNEIHAVFDIFKPTYQYANVSNKCLNQTECTFSVGIAYDEVVIVEVPTRDGIEHEDDDITFLVSVCHPRMAVYIIFPILVLFLILGCAFL